MRARKKIEVSGHLCFVKITSLLFILLLLFSCRTLPRFTGQADLCGLLVDENNIPVKDFLIYCKNDLEMKTALTDESGMFVIHGVDSGVYKISGQKKNYARLEEREFLFTDRSKIFCCQVESIEGAFKSVEELIMRGEKKNAEGLLNQLYYDKKSPQEAVILVYRFFLTEKSRDKKKLTSALRKIGKVEGVDYTQYADSLEDLIYEE